MGLSPNPPFSLPALLHLTLPLPFFPLLFSLSTLLSPPRCKAVPLYPVRDGERYTPAGNMSRCSQPKCCNWSESNLYILEGAPSPLPAGAMYVVRCNVVSLLDIAIGCANPVLGPGMWQRREPSSSSDDVIIVGCRTTNERWILTCVGGAWTGDVIGNCSTGTY